MRKRNKIENFVAFICHNTFNLLLHKRRLFNILTRKSDNSAEQKHNWHSQSLGQYEIPRYVCIGKNYLRLELSKFIGIQVYARIHMHTHTHKQICSTCKCSFHKWNERYRQKALHVHARLTCTHILHTH